jgi:glycosyltransferase involved in cell wall biosynthesis
VRVIYLGVDERFRPIEDQKAIAKVLKKYGVEYPKRYLLYVGAIEPRKNLDTAVKAYAELIKDKDFEDVEFLIVGRAGWKNAELFQLIEQLKLNNKVHFVGFVEDEDLPYFYNAAKVFVYLSKYEGFGLPPLEALACRTRVIAANNSSMREVISAPMLVNASDAKEVAYNLKKIAYTEATKESVLEINTWEIYTNKFVVVLENLLIESNALLPH